MTLTLTILGCGSSAGVPRPALGWGACDPNNPKNRRRRCSMLVERISEHCRPNTNSEMEFSGICQAEWGLQSAVFGSLDKENCNGVSMRSLRL